MFYALQARACWSGCMLSRPHSRTPGRSRCACCAQLRTIWHLAARVDSICARRAAIARAARHCAHFCCSARAYPQQISFVSAHASVFPARAVTSHAQLFMFSMEYLFFLLCARYCQICARCCLALRCFPPHCLQVPVVSKSGRVPLQGIPKYASKPDTIRTQFYHMSQVTISLRHCSTFSIRRR